MLIIYTCIEAKNNCFIQVLTNLDNYFMENTTHFGKKDTIVQMQWISLTYEFLIVYNINEESRNHTKKLSLIDSLELSPL
jgi:hypothetical protein